MEALKRPVWYVTALVLVMLLALPFSGETAQALRYSKSVSLGKVDASIMGNGTVSHVGFPVSSRGDVNGDGIDDILVGSENGAYLFFGRPDGWKMRSGISSADVRFDNPGIYFRGNDLAIIGDINGDGNDDMAFHIKNGISLIFGKPGGWPSNVSVTETADVRFMNLSRDYYWYVVGAGDVNGDGYDDMIIVPPIDHDVKAASTIFLIFGKEDGWNALNDLNESEASRIPYQEASYQTNFYQRPIAGGGDINGDGLDDIIIRYSSNVSDDYSTHRIAIIFGCETGWARDISLYSFDTNIVQNENDTEHQLGGWLDIRGDYNGDNIDDILIGTAWFGTKGPQGECLGASLIFGKARWPEKTDVASSEAFFTIKAEYSADYITACSAGDVNGDGFDDILIGNDMYGAQVKNRGATFLVLGKKTGWEIGASLESVAASMFLGETENDCAGEYIEGGGDINGDGYDDIMISTQMNPPPFDGKYYRGQTYIIFPERNILPSQVFSVKVYSDENCNVQTQTALIGDKIWIELRGIDGDYKKANIAEVRLLREKGHPSSYSLRLMETGNNTGIYKGEFTLGKITNPRHDLIGALLDERLSIQAFKQPSSSTNITIRAFKLEIDNPSKIIRDDAPYSARYYVRGTATVAWNFTTNATWLSWDSSGHSLSGIPSVGKNRRSYVNVSVLDNTGISDEINQTLFVKSGLQGIQILSPTNGLRLNVTQAQNIGLVAKGPDNASDEGLGFEWFDNGQMIAYGKNTTWTFQPGTHVLLFKATDDWYSTTDSITLSVEGPEQPPNQQTIGPTVVVSTLVVMPLMIGLTIFGLATEIGRYGSVIALAPMYTKIRKEAVLDNFKRGQIYRLIVEHPGIHYNRIIDELVLNNGTAAFHLKKLEMDDFIFSRNDGFRKRFYPSNQSVPNIPTKYEQLVAAIRLHPGITQKELAKELDMPPSTLNMYIQKMATVGIILTQTRGKTLMCFINDPTDDGPVRTHD